MSFLSSSNSQALASKLLSTPRSEYARARRQLNTKLQHLLTTLDSEAIERIRDEFAAVGFVSLPDFVRVMRDNIAWQSHGGSGGSGGHHGGDGSAGGVGVGGGGIVVPHSASRQHPQPSSSSSQRPSGRGGAGGASGHGDPHQQAAAGMAGAVAGRSGSISGGSAGMTESEFVQAVIELFHAVDVNGGQSIKFDDFLSTISTLLFFQLDQSSFHLEL